MVEHHYDPSFGADASENYERFFVPVIGRPVAEILLSVAALRPGERVLDVGCGTGVVARLAADRVGDDGAVTGLDVNPGMLAVARSAVPPDLEIEWCQASAESIPLPDETFDAVLCPMSLQFVPDRPAALREIRRVLAPGGRLALSAPGPAAPMFESLAEAMGRHVAPEAVGFVLAVFALHDETEIEGLLRDAGFRDVDVSAEPVDLSLPAPKDFLWQYVASTPLAALVGKADEEERAALEREVVDRWREFADGDRMSLRQRLVLATARR